MRTTHGQTRFVHLSPASDRVHHRNDGTLFFGAPAAPVAVTDPRALFNHHQRRLQQILREYPRPGVAAFAVHPDHGMAGHLWLEASDQVRAGTIGRHNAVDLFLPGDAQLSLRHLLVLVKTSAAGPRTRVLDLCTPAGFEGEQGGTLRAVDGVGPFVLRAAGYALFLLPTGGPLPWNPTAADPWSTLPPRLVVADARERTSARQGETHLFARPGLAPPELRPDERVAGRLHFTSDAASAALSVGFLALERGIVLGRYERCSGALALMGLDTSRVHAVLMLLDGEVRLIDAGSSNGTFRGATRIKSEPMVAGQPYTLGRMQVRWAPT